jgi:hypothetical protein
MLYWHDGFCAALVDSGFEVARFDNRVDKTSFIRDERARWKADDVRAIHDGLKDAFTRLASTAR